MSEQDYANLTREVIKVLDRAQVAGATQVALTNKVMHHLRRWLVDIPYRKMPEVINDIILEDTDLVDQHGDWLLAEVGDGAHMLFRVDPSSKFYMPLTGEVVTGYQAFDCFTCGEATDTAERQSLGPTA